MIKTYLYSIAFFSIVAVSPLQAGWTYNGTAKTITDDMAGWVMNATLSKVNGTNEITVGTVKTLPANTAVLDLRQPVADYNGSPCAIVGLKGSSFKEKAYPASLRLPDTFRTFCENNIFYNNTGLTTVEPFLPPSLKNINSWVFRGASALAGDLVLSNAQSAITLGTYLFANSKITSAILWDGITASGENMFYNCKKLADIEFGPQLATATSYTLNGCTGLSNVVFRGSAPRFTAQQFAQGCTALGFRYLVPKYDYTWEDYLEASNAKVALTATERTSYTAKFGASAPVPEYKIKISATSTGYSYDTFGYFVFQDDSLTSENAIMVKTDSIKAAGVSPAYGVHRGALTVGTPVEFSAPEYGVANSVTYRCAGYKFERLDANGWTTLADVADVCAFTYDPPSAASVKVTWKWVLAGYALTVDNSGVFPEDGMTSLGSVSVTAPNLGSSYNPGTIVTLTATATPGATFGRWLGDGVPDGHAFDNPLTITMDRSKTIYAYFATDWIYNGKGKTLKDGYWTLAGSGPTNAIVVGKPSANWAGGFLDLSKPIAGDGAFVELVEKFLTGNGHVRHVVLPRDTLKTIGSHAFGTTDSPTSTLRYVEPLLPDSVTSIGQGLCRKASGLTNDVFVFRGGVSIGGPLQFESNNGSLKEIIIGEGVRKIPADSFKGISGLTNIVIGTAVTNIGGNAFLECKEVVHFEPFLPVGIQYIGTDAFRKCGSSPNATLVLDNGKGDIQFASQNLFFETYSSISNIVVGRGVTALPAKFLVSGKRKLTEVMFYGFTTWTSSTFQTCDANKTRFLIPKRNPQWESWYMNPDNVLPWSECGSATNTYYQTFGANARRPVGKTITGPANVWIVPSPLPGSRDGLVILLQ